MADDIPSLRFSYSIFFRLRFWLHLCCYAAIWYILTGADHKSWVLGGPAIFLAALCSLLLTDSSVKSPNYFSFIFFILFFIRESFLSGVDVLRRTISPRLLLNPGLVPYTTSLPNCSSKVFFANTISLLPGTLSVDIEENIIIVHTIDTDLPVWSSLQDLERRVSTIFFKDKRELK